MIRALLLVLAMAAPAAAENVFPAVINDEPMQRNLDFLYDEIRNATQTTAASGSVYTSSVTVIKDTAITATSWGVAIATVVYAVPQTGRVVVFGLLSGEGNTAINMSCNVLIDGAFNTTGTTPSSTNGIGFARFQASENRPLNIYAVLPNIAAGTYSFALTCKVTSGQVDLAQVMGGEFWGVMQ